MVVVQNPAPCAFSVRVCGLGSAAQFVVCRAAKIILREIKSREQMKIELIIQSLGREPRHKLQCRV